MDNNQILQGSVTPVIGKEQIRKAADTLQRYKEGKANLEAKIVENQQWYRARHWEVMRDKDHDVKPASAWLFNAIASKHADAMDNAPAPNILPREEGDKEEAEKLSSIVPVLLDEVGFEDVYDAVWTYKLITGTGVYGVFWDSEKYNGLGDIAIEKIDMLNLFWDPGITDIQKSRNVFNVELVDNEVLEEQYPQLKDKLGSSSITLSKYVYDDDVPTNDKSAVVDWYYKRRVNGREVLHYCKFVNDEVLYATENEQQSETGEPLASRGWYDHGKYPFVFDPLFNLEGTPAGFGYIDIGKECQAYIDRCGQVVMDNMLKDGRSRYFIRADAEVNEAEFSDYTKDFVHVNGTMSADSIIPTQTKHLDGIYMTILESKIQELKEVTGNRDVSNGGTSGGVTSASGLAAQQEAGSKLARDSIKGSYRAYRDIIKMVIELIRQFYDTPRQFRIVGEAGAANFVDFDNRGLVPQSQGGLEFGVDTGYRIPEFDIEVSAQKASPYSKVAQNDFAMTLFSAGFFSPQMTDQALMCMDMMDFDRKAMVMDKIAQNGTIHQKYQALMQQAMMLAQLADRARGTNELSANLAMQFQQEMGGPVPAGGAPTKLPAEARESSVTAKARERTAEMTSPR